VYAALMGRKIVNNQQIARATGLSPKTIRSFFSGARWPSPETLLAFEETLKWEPGTIQTRADMYDEAGALDIEPRNATERAILASDMPENDKLRIVLLLRQQQFPRVAEGGNN
jgi:Helix-turn-helix